MPTSHDTPGHVAADDGGAPDRGEVRRVRVPDTSHRFKRTVYCTVIPTGTVCLTRAPAPRVLDEDRAGGAGRLQLARDGRALVDAVVGPCRGARARVTISQSRRLARRTFWDTGRPLIYSPTLLTKLDACLTRQIF